MKRFRGVRLAWCLVATGMLLACSFVMAWSVGSMLREFGIELGSITRIALPLSFFGAGVLGFGVIVSAVSGLLSASRCAMGVPRVLSDRVLSPSV